MLPRTQTTFERAPWGSSPSARAASLLSIPILLLLSAPLPAAALTPGEILVVANRDVPESAPLARYYMKCREVPEENLYLLSTVKEEGITREKYEAEIASPLRTYLYEHDPEGKKIRCILLMYGIPLRVYPPALTPAEEARLARLRSREKDLTDVIKALDQAPNVEDEKKRIQAEQDTLRKQVQDTSRSLEGASVDSELALIMEPAYPLLGWILNPYYIPGLKKEQKVTPRRVIHVCRLDGPDAGVVVRIIEDSIGAERNGLEGTAYFDAQWPEGKAENPYTKYDRALHRTAAYLEEQKAMPVVLDEREAVLQPGEAPATAALYCGWYSASKYVDAFTWAKGAIGYHMASSECVNLRDPSSTRWCKIMLQKGAAATLGPVAEPYLWAFPEPQVFFACLVEGQETLVECYTLSNPFWSWQMVLIGDPLYRPFAYRRQHR